MCIRDSLSTAGPFARYSNLIVKSCVENKTHYTDITGENHWVKDLIDEYHEKALEDGTRILLSGYTEQDVDDVTDSEDTYIETQADNFIDFSDADPFSEGGNF